MNRAVFFDLQGTLGGDGLDSIMEFSFFPNSIKAIKKVNESELLAIVLTNQGKIAKGHLNYEQYERKLDTIKDELKANDARFDGVYCCPHERKDKCECMKPFPGMAYKAKDDFDLDLKNSYIIGDTGAWDMVLAKNIGCKMVLVKTGLGGSSLNQYRYSWKDIIPNHIARDVLDGVNWILNLEKRKSNMIKALDLRYLFDYKSKE